MRVILLFLAVILALTGCSRHVISKEALLLVDQSASFAAVSQNPGAFTGKFLLAGGSVAQVRNTPSGAELEVVQLPLGSDDRPNEKGPSEGRFLARATGFLDPLIYKQGRLVTMVGEVAGSETRPLEGIDYAYPILDVRELYVWRPEDPYASPPVYFGIGVGVGF